MKYRISVYCSLFVGAPYWHGTEIYEPDECGYEYEIETDAEDVHDGQANVICPKCNQEAIVPVDDDTILEVIMENSGTFNEEQLEWGDEMYRRKEG